jgi:nifR3 family TIM-barrel protein
MMTQKRCRVVGFRIGSLELENPLVLAPMAGFTDLPFRRICRRLGAALTYTEMVSAQGLVLGNPMSRRLILSDGSDRPFAVQIFGSDPDVMAQAARICQEEGADLVDINMGCPVPKVVKRGAGAALLERPLVAGRILEAVRRVLRIPLTIKVRSGWTAEQVVAPEIARMAQECGVDAIALHARPRSQGYTHCAQWALIRQLRESVSIPVIGNGDVLSPADALTLRDATGCQGIMIGRGARGGPWIFSRALAMLEGGRLSPEPAGSEVWRIVETHLESIRDHYAPDRALHVAKAHLLRYLRGRPASARVRESAVRASSVAALRAIVRDHLTLLASEPGEEGVSSQQ